MCLSPYRYKDKITGQLHEANCQQCPECRLLISNHFSLRIKTECKKENYIPYFLTLTISDEFYVYTPKQYKHLIINLLKQMRYHGEKFKYILSVERGDLSGRLHAHFIFLSKRKKLSFYNFIISYYYLGFIQLREASYHDIHYVVSYIYDGVLYRTFSKGLGKPLTDEELYLIFLNLPYSEIPLYYRRLVKEKNEGLFKRKLNKYLWSDQMNENYRKSKSIEWKNKKFDKLLQLRYALENYIKPTYKVDSVTGRRLQDD